MYYLFKSFNNSVKIGGCQCIRVVIGSQIDDS